MTLRAAPSTPATPRRTSARPRSRTSCGSAARAPSARAGRSSPASPTPPSPARRRCGPATRRCWRRCAAAGSTWCWPRALDRFSPRPGAHRRPSSSRRSFAGVRIVTLAEGEISELHVGLKGTMGALYLKDLADKTRRGLEGRVREGRSGGGLCYGYRVVRGPVGPRRRARARPARDRSGRRPRSSGGSSAEFAAGAGPAPIAAALNREGVPGPRGGIWSTARSAASRGRDTGILRNRLYAGELVWNRRRWIKDPTPAAGLARQNGARRRRGRGRAGAPDHRCRSSGSGCRPAWPQRSDEFEPEAGSGRLPALLGAEAAAAPAER